MLTPNIAPATPYAVPRKLHRLAKYAPASIFTTCSTICEAAAGRMSCAPLIISAIGRRYRRKKDRGCRDFQAAFGGRHTDPAGKGGAQRIACYTKRQPQQRREPARRAEICLRLLGPAPGQLPATTAESAMEIPPDAAINSIL